MSSFQSEMSKCACPLCAVIRAFTVIEALNNSMNN